MNKLIIDEVKKVLITLGILKVLIILAFLIAGKLDYTVFLGLLLGCVFTVLNLILLGQAVEKCLYKSPKKAQFFMGTQYLARFTLTAILIYIAFTSSVVNPYGVIIPIFAPKITYFAIGIYNTFTLKKGRKKVGN